MRTLIITATILVPTAASAGGYIVPNVNPRNLALAESAVADQTGPEAIFLNTADLSSQEGLGISVAGTLANNRTDWSDPVLGMASLSENTTPPMAAVSYGEKLPFDQAWGVGIGFGALGGGTVRWQDGWAGQEEIRLNKARVFGFGAGAAFQLLPYFRFGLNYLRYQADQEIHQAANYLDHIGDAGVALSGGGNSIGVATEIVPPQIPLKVGITYQHSSTLGLTGHVHFSDVPPALQPMLYDQPISLDVLMPDVVRAGVAYEASPGLMLMGSYTFEHWSEYKSDKFVGDGGFMRVVPRNFNNFHTIGVAGEWRHLPFLPQLTVRAGVSNDFDSQPPSDTLAPSITDASRLVLSIGAGFDILPKLRVDVGYQHLFYDTVTATGADAFPGTYKTAVDYVAVGIDWRMDVARNH